MSTLSDPTVGYFAPSAICKTHYTQFKGKLVRGVFCTCRKIPHLLIIASFYKNLPSSDPVSMTSVIAVVIALLIIFLVLVISLLIAYKKQKLCFQGRNSDSPCCPSSSKFSGSDPSNCYSSPPPWQPTGLYLGFSVIIRRKPGATKYYFPTQTCASRHINFFDQLTHLILF